MRKYFIHDGQIKKGPFNLEELKGLQLKKGTLVWYDGLKEWAKAADLEDLKDYFIEKTNPPPLPKTFEINTASRNKILSSFDDAAEVYSETSQKRSLLLPIIITIVILLGIIATIFFYH